jgi:hypothetical protein
MIVSVVAVVVYVIGQPRLRSHLSREGLDHRGDILLKNLESPAALLRMGEFGLRVAAQDTIDLDSKIDLLGPRQGTPCSEKAAKRHCRQQTQSDGLHVNSLNPCSEDPSLYGSRKELPP